jgi:hypothetical protein
MLIEFYVWINILITCLFHLSNISLVSLHVLSTILVDASMHITEQWHH